MGRRCGSCAGDWGGSLVLAVGLMAEPVQELARAAGGRCAEPAWTLLVQLGLITQVPVLAAALCHGASADGQHSGPAPTAQVADPLEMSGLGLDIGLPALRRKSRRAGTGPGYSFAVPTFAAASGQPLAPRALQVRARGVSC